MTPPQNVFVIGAGGHAAVVISVLQECGVDVAGIFDDDSTRRGSDILGVKILGPISDLQQKIGADAVIAIGHNRTRQKIAATLSLNWISVIHPRAYVHHSVALGPGSVVCAGAIIQPRAVVGEHVIVNTSATVDHDCALGDYVHIAPGAHLAGAVQVGEGTMLGIGSMVIQGIRIGSWAMVGAAAAVVRDVPDSVTVIGVPACIKEIK